MNQDFENEESIHHTINESKENFVYPDEFQIINEEVYDLIKKRQQILNQTKRSYIINSNKIIMQYILGPLYELVIMRLDFSKDIFLIDKLLKYYNNEEIFNSHYELLKKFDLDYYMKNKINQNIIIEGTNLVGEMFILNEESEIGINSQKNEINDKNKKIKELLKKGNSKSKSTKDITEDIDKNEENKNNIKLLFNIHFFLHNLKLELSNKNFQNILIDIFLLKNYKNL